MFPNLYGCQAVLKKVISELKMQFNVSKFHKDTSHNFLKVSTSFKVLCLDGQILSSYFLGVLCGRKVKANLIATYL